MRPTGRVRHAGSMTGDQETALTIRPLDPGSAAEVAAVVDLLTAVDAADAPWRRSTTALGVRQEHLLGWDGDPEPFYPAYLDGTLVAVGGFGMPLRDNLDTAWVFAVVHPGHRRQGIGTQVLRAMEQLAHDAGRPLLSSYGLDLPACRPFAASVGYEPRMQTVVRRVTFADLATGAVDAAYEQALGYAADYELIRVAGPLPEDLMAGYLAAVAAINDAPREGLDYGDEVFDAARVRAYEHSRAARGETLYRVIARHRRTGEFAGHTVVTVDPQRPQWGDQHDTTVVEAHRGHRLGLLVKADMMRWLTEVEPECHELTTSNAESNTHMIAVNEALGYRVLARGLAFQRTLPRSDDRGYRPC